MFVRVFVFSLVKVHGISSSYRSSHRANFAVHIWEKPNHFFNDRNQAPLQQRFSFNPQAVFFLGLIKK